MDSTPTYGGIVLGGIAKLLTLEEIEGLYFRAATTPPTESFFRRIHAAARRTMLKMYLDNPSPWRLPGLFVSLVTRRLLDGEPPAKILPSESPIGRPSKKAEITARRRMVDELRLTGHSLEGAAEIVAERFGVSPETIKRRHYHRDAR
ncbi:uncharacterized protein METZ01_LOCUS467282 [marine metagenome]|uniref:Uncharacterized protein n=1 Tax=marine metagenome TaxID=408172 RepID=A0A383B4Z2_9ZZZZ